MTELTQSVREVEAAIRNALSALGFTSWKRDSTSSLGFKREINNEIVQCIVINKATYPREGFSLSVVIGVIHLKTEHLAARLCHWREGLGYMTVSSQIGYLMPERQYKKWDFPIHKNQVLVDDLIKTIKKYGLPFFQKHSSLNKIIQKMKREYGVNDMYRFLSPSGSLYCRAKRRGETLFNRGKGSYVIAKEDSGCCRIS